MPPHLEFLRTKISYIHKSQHMNEIKPTHLKYRNEKSPTQILIPHQKPQIFATSPALGGWTPHYSSMAVTSVSASAFLGSWGTSVAGEDHALLQAKAAPPQLRVATRPVRPRPMMGGASSQKGVFAPIVVLTRNIIGKKTFNQLRGKAIALHSQVITEFCKSIGADNKQRQGLIRLAKKNGEWLGFLA